MNQRPAVHDSSRRGVALVLVLIALALSVLLASTFLDSRQGSVPMADGLAAASRARRAANSGLELALATINRNDDWVNRHANGVFADNLDIHGVKVRIELTDLDTDAPPTTLTRACLIDSIANSNGVEIRTQSEIPVTPTDRSLDLNFGEVALLAETEIRLNGESALVPWLSDQRTMNSNPVVMGTLNGNPDDVHIGQHAIAVDGITLEVDERTTRISGPTAGTRAIPDALPSIVAATIPETNESLGPKVILKGEHAGDIHATEIRVPAGNELRITGDSILKSQGAFNVEPGARIIIENGKVVFDAQKRMKIKNATIEKADGAELIVVSRKQLVIDGSTFRPCGIDICPHGNTPPTSAVEDIRILGDPDSESVIRIKGQSLLMASINAGNADISLRDSTVLYGRVHGKEITLTDQTVVYAAPDNGDVIGLTNLKGPHRDSAGELLDVLKTADRVEDAKMVEIASLLNIPVEADSRLQEVTISVAAAQPQAASRSRSNWNWALNGKIDWYELRQAARRFWVRGGRH